MQFGDIALVTGLIACLLGAGYLIYLSNKNTVDKSPSARNAPPIDNTIVTDPKNLENKGQKFLVTDTNESSDSDYAEIRLKTHFDLEDLLTDAYSLAKEIETLEDGYGVIFGKYDADWSGDDAINSLTALSHNELLEWSQKLESYLEEYKEATNRRETLLDKIGEMDRLITHKSDYRYGALCNIGPSIETNDFFKNESELRKRTKWYNSTEAKLELQQAEEKRRIMLKECINKHYITLKKNFSRSIKLNDYGAIEQDNRIDEFIRFLDSVGFSVEQHGISLIDKPEWRDDDGRPKDLMKAEYLSNKRVFEEYKLILSRFDREKIEDASKGFDLTSIPEDGYEFENWIASSLKIFGWQSSVTTASGDQGVDVIAEKNSITVGIQCKRYSGVVGNKAVQEVAAGRQHFGLDFGAVVTTSRFTKSADELASTNDILLLTVDQLPDLENIINDISNRRH